MASVVVVGLGYVGLPLALAAVDAGHLVTGLDCDEARVKGLLGGTSPTDGVTDADVRIALGAAFTPTTEPAAIASADVVLICVPTGLTACGRPDLGPLHDAARIVGEHITARTLVVAVSTSYPGSTTEVILPQVDRGRFTLGHDLWVAVSPERGSPGEDLLMLARTPRVVGGLTRECTRRAVEFFSTFVERVTPAAGAAEAELSKLLENSFRLINIALVEELVPIARDLDIDLWDAIDCAATKPFGFMAFRPGPGAGGHCIPVDPMYLADRARVGTGHPARLLELAADINAEAPLHVAARARELLERGPGLAGADVLLLGVSYKPNVADTRGTPATTIARVLVDGDANVRFHDPLVEEWHVPAADPSGSSRVLVLERAMDAYAAAAAADLTVLLQPHDSYDLARLAASARLLLDTRGALRAFRRAPAAGASNTGNVVSL